MSMRTIVLLALATVAALASTGAAADDRCRDGYVWREAFPGDHVCVTPQVRKHTARDNKLAPRRRQRGGGAYGPDTCVKGYVWREARKDDHVCVTPETRSQVASDNKLGASRFAASSSTDGRPRQGLVRRDGSGVREFIECPARRVRAEITTSLPADWWQTPQEGALVGAEVENIGGKPTLVCRYRAYGATVSVMRNAPAGKRCQAGKGKFLCSY